jgi:hypothetical protein
MLEHSIFKKILRILIGSGILVAIGFSVYGIYEWNMTRTYKTTGLFCPTEEPSELDILIGRLKGYLYKIEENKRNGIKKISYRSEGKWYFIEFDEGVASITIGKNPFGESFKPKKGTLAWNASSFSILDRTTLIIKRFDADGNFIEGSERQCEINNQLIKTEEERTKYNEEAKSKEIKEIIDNRKI